MTLVGEMRATLTRQVAAVSHMHFNSGELDHTGGLKHGGNGARPDANRSGTPYKTRAFVHFCGMFVCARSSYLTSVKAGARAVAEACASSGI